MSSSPSKPMGPLQGIFCMNLPSPSKRSCLSYANNSDNINENFRANKIQSVEETHFEDAFRGYLGSLKHTIMSCTHRNFDDEKSVLRTQELVKEDIRKAMFQLSSSSSSPLHPTYAHKVTAFTFVGSKLLSEVEDMQNCVALSEQIETLTAEKEKLKQFYQQRETELNATLSILEKRNAELAAGNIELETRGSAAALEVTDTRRELDIRNRMDDGTHEKYVQLHLDIMAYHARVQSMAHQSLRCVRARVGFVPREVEAHLQALLQAEAPGTDLVFAASSACSPVRKKRAVVASQGGLQDRSQRRRGGGGGKQQGKAAAVSLVPDDMSREEL